MSAPLKQIGFAPDLQPLVLSGEKYSTWRLFDDKNLTVGDVLEFVESKSRKPFAKALLTEITEKPLGKLTENDWKGHEKFSSDEEVYQTYSGYYNKPVGPETLVKVVRFKLL